MSDNAVSYSLATDGIPDLEDLWEMAKEKYGTTPQDKKPENHNKQTGKNKMKKIRNKKIRNLIVVYIILIIVELFFFVPYHSIQIFRTNQNVPHTEIIGNGYTTMSNIARDYVYFYGNDSTSRMGKIVNTPQLFMNVSITTIVAAAIYVLFLNEKKKTTETQYSIFDIAEE